MGSCTEPFLSVIARLCAEPRIKPDAVIAATTIDPHLVGFWLFHLWLNTQNT